MTSHDDIVSLDLCQLNGKRWVSYFNLLGFANDVKTQNTISIFCKYERVLREQHWGLDWSPKLRTAWFSDAFLIYTTDESKEAFMALEGKSRSFMEILLRVNIPLRGAMAYGELYVDQPKNVFFGKGLLDAYRYESRQEWIGFVLCPSVFAQMPVVGLNYDVLRSNNKWWPVPMKSESRCALCRCLFQFCSQKLNLPRRKVCLYAYMLGIMDKSTQGGNTLVPILKSMRNSYKDNSVIRKYSLTLKFMETFKVFSSPVATPKS